MMNVSRYEQLCRAFVRLADTLVDEYDVVELLGALVDESAVLARADAGGLVLADSQGRLQVIASTDEEAEFVEINQLNAGEGPCVDAFRTGEPVSVPSIADEHERWPAFHDSAMQQGYRSMHAFPMRLRGDTIGAMNLFSYAEGDLDDLDVLIAQALTDVATISILQQRTIEEQARLTEQLQRALDSRVIIEQAKGVIAAQLNIDMTDAFRLLRTEARSRQRKLSEFAQQIAAREIVLPGASAGATRSEWSG